MNCFDEQMVDDAKVMRQIESVREEEICTRILIPRDEPT